MPAPVPVAGLPLSAIAASLHDGARVLRATPRVSLGFSALFAAVALLAALLLWRADLMPLMITAAGGFMLVGPALLAGYFRLARVLRAGGVPGWRDLLAGFREAPRQLWGLALVCALLLMIWLTDAGILYSFMIGAKASEAGGGAMGRFLGWSAPMGALLAFIIYAVTAFSVPLLCERRAGLVPAVVASVRAVFGNFPVLMLWALLLAATMILSILLLPLFVVAFPLLAYASEALHGRVFARGVERG
ncbi:MAG: DUF2189 domain-containing protein [Sterolibacteriaceae bacterium]|nr:DUF2189 domain-containing protein [Candidatus Methylophosphatis haderslevensis]